MNCPTCGHAIPDSAPLEILTHQQAAVLQAIHRLTADKGYPPTVREIGDAVGLRSSSTVHGHLRGLQRKGCIAWEREKPRSLRVLVLVENEETPGSSGG